MIGSSLVLGCLTLVLGSGCNKSSDNAPATGSNAPVTGGNASIPTALDVLKKADAAHKALKVVKYSINFDTTSPSRTTPKVEAEVILEGWGAFGLPKRFRADAVVMHAAPAKLTIGSDGERFYVIDHARKKVHAAADPRVLGTARDILRGIVIAELVHPTPFTDEITKARSRELKEDTKIGSEDCYQVEVKHAAGTRSARWFFSKTSFLARAVHRIQTGMGGQEVARQILSSLEVSPVADTAFAMVAPPEYVTTADPAE